MTRMESKNILKEDRMIKIESFKVVSSPLSKPYKNNYY